MAEPAAPPAPRYLAAGTGGLVVEFGATVDEALNRRVIALDAALGEAAVAGIRELVPTYRSLLVLFDPEAVSRAALVRRVDAVLASCGDAAPVPARCWSVPVRYGGPCGADLERVAEIHSTTPQAVVDAHAGSMFRVYMIGFAPGFSYLGGLDPAIHTGRRSEPRAATPARSISIGGAQSAISPPLELPSGWHLLGQTPVRSYDPARADQPFLFRAGDRVRFRPVGQDEYEALCAAAEAGELVATLAPDAP